MPLLDVLWNMLIFFIFMWVIQVVKPEEKQKKQVEIKAEFIIAVEWPVGNNDDVDVYLEDPVGNLIFYQKKDAGLMHMDRDDLGSVNDRIKTDQGWVEYHENKELITIRGIIPGEYILNVHMFSKRDKNPIIVTITMTKLNPHSIVFLKTVELVTHGDEKTVARFTMDGKGKVVSLSEDGKKFIGASDRYNNQWRSL